MQVSLPNTRVVIVLHMSTVQRGEQDRATLLIIGQRVATPDPTFFTPWRVSSLLRVVIDDYRMAHAVSVHVIDHSSS